MKFAVLAIFALAVCFPSAEAMRKPPDIELLTCNARHNEGKISLDGRVRNSGEKSIATLTLAFDFLDSDGTLLTTQKSAIEEEIFEPGREATFHFELDAPPRAIKCQVNAFDANGRELRVAKAGPFTID